MPRNIELDLQLAGYYEQTGAYVSPWLIYGLMEKIEEREELDEDGEELGSLE